MSSDELDRLAAIKIMGWTLIQMHATIDCWDAGGPNKIPCMQWRPTRNIAQAWEVLEETISSVSLYAATNISHGKTYNCVIACQIKDVFGAYAEANADTAPLAIVKACLKAKGVEV